MFCGSIIKIIKICKNVDIYEMKKLTKMMGFCEKNKNIVAKYLTI